MKTWLSAHFYNNSERNASNFAWLKSQAIVYNNEINKIMYQYDK